MLNIWRVVHSFREYGLSYPRGLALSGTPLNEALITFRKLLPEFQKKAKVEKVQCIVLTDGEAGHFHITLRSSVIGKMNHI